MSFDFDLPHASLFSPLQGRNLQFIQRKPQSSNSCAQLVNHKSALCYWICFFHFLTIISSISKLMANAQYISLTIETL
jgi:hypothetical protein